MKQPTSIKKLDFNEAKEFEKAKKEFTKEEINKALYGLFKQQNENIASMYLRPKHFLKNISKYFNAELSKNILFMEQSEQNRLLEEYFNLLWITKR
jgi:hypothetical protein